ncbi:MAG: hypothetical protein WCV84_03740 [Patescibacteria group bacterium]
MEPNVSSPFSGPLAAPTPTPTPEPSPSSSTDVVVISAIVIALAILIAGGAYAWKRSSKPTTVSSRNATTTDAGRVAGTQVTGTAPALEIIPADPATNPVMTLVQETLGDLRFSLEIPSEYRLIRDTPTSIAVQPNVDPTDPDRTDYYPTVIIRVHKNASMEAQMLTSIKDAPTGEQLWQDTVVNGLTGKVFNLENKGYPESNLVYLLRRGNDIIELVCWEFVPWEEFDRVVATFNVQ